MIKRILAILLWASFGSLTNTNAQLRCKDVKMENITMRVSTPVCFTRDTIPNNKYFTTKYIITNGSAEIYDIGFDFFKDLDSVAIYFFDKQTKKIVTRGIKFDWRWSYTVMKNYTFNDTLIDYNKEYHTILYSIPNLNYPYIILNEFKAIGDEDIYFKLQPIPDDVWKIYLENARTYLRMTAKQQKDSSEWQTKISILKKEMKEYKDSSIDKIIKDEEVNKMNWIPRPADLRLQEEFNNKVEPIFINYLKTLYLFNDNDIAARFSFTCKGDNRLDQTLTKTSSPNGSSIDWFKDTFNIKIKHDIETMNFNTIVQIEDHQALKETFNNLFKERLDKLNSDGKKFGSDGNEFAETLTQIYADFEPFLTRKVNAPTLYTYDIKYMSKVEEATWRLAGNGEIKPKDHPELVDELRDKFIEKTANKAGRYDFQICTVYINNKKMGRDIKLIPKKETLNY